MSIAFLRHKHCFSFVRAVYNLTYDTDGIVIMSVGNVQLPRRRHAEMIASLHVPRRLFKSIITQTAVRTINTKVCEFLASIMYTSYVTIAGRTPTDRQRNAILTGRFYGELSVQTDTATSSLLTSSRCQRHSQPTRVIYASPVDDGGHPISQALQHCLTINTLHGDAQTESPTGQSASDEAPSVLGFIDYIIYVGATCYYPNFKQLGLLRC